MIKKNQSIISTINIISDIFLLFISYYISLVIRFEILNGYVSINLRESKFMVAFITYSLVIVGVYACFHVYESHRFKKLSSEIFIIFIVNAVGVVSLMAVL